MSGVSVSVKPNKLTVPEALRLANHDFLNRLQMIMMYNELGKQEQCQAYITKAVNEMQVVSAVNRAGTPVLAEWLLTVGWRYNEFAVALTSTVTGTATVAETAIVAYVEACIAAIAKQVDVYCEQYITLDYTVKPANVALAMRVTGQWQTPIQLTEKNERFTVNIKASTTTMLDLCITAKQGVK